LAKHGIPPSQAILVGDTVEDERRAEHAKLARFFWAWHYFGDTSMGSA
jgi:phosphoglycolate phosphatase-like HAD superfamily hydrolase